MKTLSILSFFVFAFSCSQSAGQTKDEPTPKFAVVEPTFLAKLPGVCDESSGLELVEDMIVTMNDSGGKDVLYFVSQKGEMVKELKLKDAKNVDWEDVAYSGDTFYVGDFGNNLGNRKDLTVYQLQEMNGEKADTKTIEFSYKNQEDYSIKNRNHSFDCESMIAFDDELVLFSKDWATLATQVYHLPINTEEEQILEPSEKIQIDALITGADYDAETKTLVLSGYNDYVNYVWVFRNSTPNKLLTNEYTRLEMKGLVNAQVEGITFYDNEKIIISSEETKEFQEQLWVVDITKF